MDGHLLEVAVNSQESQWTSACVPKEYTETDREGCGGWLWFSVVTICLGNLRVPSFY